MPALPVQPLGVGVSEANPNLFAPGDVAPGFAVWRDRLVALHPAVDRLVVFWPRLQPDPDRPADLAQPQDGCIRGAGPCAGWAGVDAQLQALAAARRAYGGFATLVVVYGVPDWAARPPSGCEREAIGPRSRPMTPQGLSAYGELVRRVVDRARSFGVELAAVAPWNEPNYDRTISPQRAACDRDAPPMAPAVYATIVREAQRALAGTGVPLALGELAGNTEPTPRRASIREFVDALPDDVLCAGAIYTQHAYVPGTGQVSDAVGALEAALASRPCTAGKPIWVTETGTGGTPAGSARPVDPASLLAQCRALAAQLVRWDRDPRVGLALQYSIREDPAYPVGLVDTALTRAYPTFDLWAAWGSGEIAGPSTCSDNPRPEVEGG